MELIRACAESNDAAHWREFIRLFNRPIALSIARVVQRWGARPQEYVDDLMQETYLRLCADKCKRLYQFALAYPDSTEAYIRAIAVNIGNDFFKALKSKKRGGGEVLQLLDTMEPKAHHAAAGGEAAIQRDMLLREIDSCLAENVDNPLKTRDHVIFWLYYGQGVTAENIASIPAMKLSVKGVESVIHRLTRLVRNRLAKTPGTPGQDSGSTQKGLEPPNSY